MEINMPTAMNIPTAMDMPVTDMGDMELRVLSDSELDDVNGGLIFLAVGAFVFAMGFTMGFGITNAILHRAP